MPEMKGHCFLPLPHARLCVRHSWLLLGQLVEMVAGQTCFLSQAWKGVVEREEERCAVIRQLAISILKRPKRQLPEERELATWATENLRSDLHSTRGGRISVLLMPHLEPGR